MAVSETLTLWQMEGFPNVFICIPLPPFSSFLLDAVTAVSALQSTTEDRELGYVEKLLSETEGEGEMPGCHSPRVWGPISHGEHMQWREL